MACSACAGREKERSDRLDRIEAKIDRVLGRQNVLARFLLNRFKEIDTLLTSEIGLMSSQEDALTAAIAELKQAESDAESRVESRIAKLDAQIVLLQQPPDSRAVADAIQTLQAEKAKLAAFMVDTPAPAPAPVPTPAPVPPAPAPTPPTP